MQDKRTLVARVVGIDETTDLALLRVNYNGLKALSIGDSDRLEVGEWVLAVGNPFDLNSTITAGIVSAKARNINILKGQYSIESFIQTDAVVNPGNSGGALVNTRGELIGVNTAIISESGGYEGYSFAIPSNLVRKVVNDLREFGEVKRAVLGVNIADVNSRIAAELSLPSVEGVYVTNVNQGSSAFEAGLRAGDVIISVNSAKIASMPELQEQVALFRPGDRVSLEYYRGGRKHRIDNVVLKSITDTASLRFR
ncbi:MAG: trypsin-like peptidase domain-containing protein [Saprospiraceae bacterium]|nr:trypsin-like peptidase domain-containing protein [Saprospiraceae bacterium]